MAGGLIGLLDESPVFLMQEGRTEDAMRVMRKLTANSPQCGVSVLQGSVTFFYQDNVFHYSI